MATARRFVTLDVFTDEALSGNPLAIVLDAEGLDDARMQAIAREFNLSETVFVLPPENPGHRARLRIFTPASELAFAGHPTVGTAIFLASRDWGEGATRDGIVVLEEGVGPVRVGVQLRADAAGFAEFDLPEIPREVGRLPSRGDLASAVGLMANDIGFDNHRPSLFSVGGAFVFLPVRDLEALGRARPVRALWRPVFDAGRGMAYLYTRAERDAGRNLPPAFRARMFAPLLGIEEDPATGSAAGALAGVVARFEPVADGRHEVAIEQGVEMGRPSRISLEVELAAGEVTAARVGGEAVLVSEGVLHA